MPRANGRTEDSESSWLLASASARIAPGTMVHIEAPQWGQSGDVSEARAGRGTAGARTDIDVWVGADAETVSVQVKPFHHSVMHKRTVRQQPQRQVRQHRQVDGVPGLAIMLSSSHCMPLRSMRTSNEQRPPSALLPMLGFVRVQVHASHATSVCKQLHTTVSDAPIIAPLTVDEAAALRLPVPKNMVQAVRVAPSLSGADAGSAAADASGVAALRMTVTVPSRFCGVSVNQSGLHQHTCEMTS